MIHTLRIPHAGHTFLFRFTADRIGDLRFKLCILADAGQITWDQAFEGHHKIRSQIEGTSEMDEIEALKDKLIRAGFYPQVNAHHAGWTCLLFTSVEPKTFHRPPCGHGNTALAAMIAADLDRAGMLQAKQKV